MIKPFKIIFMLFLLPVLFLPGCSEDAGLTREDLVKAILNNLVRNVNNLSPLPSESKTITGATSAAETINEDPEYGLHIQGTIEYEYSCTNNDYSDCKCTMKGKIDNNVYTDYRLLSHRLTGDASNGFVISFNRNSDKINGTYDYTLTTAGITITGEFPGVLVFTDLKLFCKATNSSFLCDRTEGTITFDGEDISSEL